MPRGLLFDINNRPNRLLLKPWEIFIRQIKFFVMCPKATSRGLICLSPQRPKCVCHALISSSSCLSMSDHYREFAFEYSESFSPILFLDQARILLLHRLIRHERTSIFVAFVHDKKGFVLARKIFQGTPPRGRLRWMRRAPFPIVSCV